MFLTKTEPDNKEDCSVTVHSPRKVRKKFKTYICPVSDQNNKHFKGGTESCTQRGTKLLLRPRREPIQFFLLNIIYNHL